MPLRALPSATRLLSVEPLTVEDISPEDWLAREVYATYGLAVYHTQVLEHGILNLLEWTGIRDSGFRRTLESETDSASQWTRTMGAIRNVLLKRRPDAAHLTDLLARAVRLRNFLAHEYFRERATAWMTEEGQQENGR
jgi:hypothetical protein